MKFKLILLLTVFIGAAFIFNAYSDLTVHETTTYYTSSMSIAGPKTTTVYDAPVDWTLYIHYKYKMNGFRPPTLIETCWKLYDENYKYIAGGCY